MGPTNPLHDNTRRAATVLLGGFLVIALALGYWQVVRAGDLGSDGANPRVVEARLNQPRGRILDRAGQVLAQSEQTKEGYRRRYAEPSLVHTIGFHSARFGDTNLEERYDAQLRGERTPDALDRLKSDLLHQSVPPVPADLVLTVDKRVHDAAVAALSAADANGAIVALDPRSGAVLAMAARPFFNPNATDEQLAALQNDPNRPLYNRAVQALYVPGSTFKAVTASAAVDLGLVDLDQPFACTTAVRVGTYAVDCKNSIHVPRLTYRESFAWSTNRTFALTGLLLDGPKPINPWLSDTPPGPYPWTREGFDVKAPAGKLEDYARRFGFTREIPFDLPVTPSRIKGSTEAWYPTLLAQTAFGQGELEATPMQMALVAAAIANEGRVPTPYLVAEVRAGNGAVSRPNPGGQSFSRAMSANTAKVMTAFMLEGVEKGYASKAAIPGVQVGGKTGTAEAGDGTSHSWFIGFAPIENPRVAIAVIGEHKGAGADFATAAAQRVMRVALEATEGR